MNHLCPPADDLFSPKSRGLTIFNNLHVTHRDASKQVTRLLAWIKEWHALCRRKLILWEYISLLVVPKISRTILLVYDSLRSGVLCLFPPVLLILALCGFLGVVFSYGLPLRFSRSSLKIFHPSVFCCVPSHLSLLNSPSFFLLPPNRDTSSMAAAATSPRFFIHFHFLELCSSKRCFAVTRSKILGSRFHAHSR